MCARSPILRCLPVLAACFLVGSSLPAPAVEAGSQEWICVHHAHEVASHEPGTCPVCGMDLVRRDEVVHAAILVFDGVQIIDYAAPYEVFGQARFYTFLVSPDGAPITTAMGMRVTPHFAIAEAPRPDLILVPGGNVEGHLEDERILDWIRRASREAEHVLSVCNGAFFLAEAGMLDGLSATTFHRLLVELAMRYPRVEVLRGARFVDNGKIVTSAGLSAGIDGAIRIVEKVNGHEAAQRLADHIEYEWDPSVGEREGVPVGRKLSEREAHLYDGVYEFRNGGTVTVGGSVEDGILYAWIEGERYPLLPQGADRFLATSGDEVLFVRDGEGGVVGYRSTADGEATLYRRVGKDAVPAGGEGTPEN